MNNKFEWFDLKSGGPTRAEALRGVWLYSDDGEGLEWSEYDPNGYDPLKQGFTHFSYYPRPTFPEKEREPDYDAPKALTPMENWQRNDEHNVP